MSTFDSNVWYQMIESRVDFNSSWYAGSNDTYFAAANTSGSIYWQIFNIDNDIYQIRNRAWNLKKQLSVCFVSTEKDASKTQPCSQPADGSKAQQWNISPWGDGTYRIFNVANGSDTTLDVHPGNPPFISTNISQTPTKQVAQHWEFQQLDLINDAVYSTQVTALAQAAATSSGSSPSSTSPSASSTTPTSAGATNLSAVPTTSGLSSGAQAGIGVGVAIVVLALIGLISFFLWRRRKARQAPLAAELTGTPSKQAGELPSDHVYQELATPEKAHEMYSGPAGAELSSAPVYSELPGHEVSRGKYGQ